MGAFNDYDSNKVLCRLGDRGELLEVAYRWARAILLMASAGPDRIDVNLVGDALDETRRALRELARIEAKAKAIAQGADEIRSLLTVQIRRINPALDDAAAGLTYREACAS